MKHRPWPIIVLAVIQFLTPIGNILLSSFLMKLNVVTYLSLFWEQKTAFEVFDFVGVYFIAGAAILAVKSWSYPVFFGVVTWNLFQIFQSWSEFPGVISLGMVLGLYAVNLAIVAYVLIPTVRAAYFDPSIRWWENQPRYQVSVTAKATGVFGDAKCQVTDFSLGGVFLTTDQFWILGEYVGLKMRIMEQDLEVTGRVVHHRSGGSNGYGIQFNQLDEATQIQVTRMVKAMESMRLERRPERRDYIEDFVSWARGVLTRGEGLVPEIVHRTPTPKPAQDPVSEPAAKTAATNVVPIRKNAKAKKRKTNRRKKPRSKKVA